jgi:FixJ family two-component response regulator
MGNDFVLKEGVNFLQKPYPPQKLVETVRNGLEAEEKE